MDGGRGATAPKCGDRFLEWAFSFFLSVCLSVRSIGIFLHRPIPIFVDFCIGAVYRQKGPIVRADNFIGRPLLCLSHLRSEDRGAHCGPALHLEFSALETGEFALRTPTTPLPP